VSTVTIVCFVIYINVEYTRCIQMSEEMLEIYSRNQTLSFMCK